MASAAAASSSLNSEFPVLVPADEALFYDNAKFEEHLKSTVRPVTPSSTPPFALGRGHGSGRGRGRGGSETRTRAASSERGESNTFQASPFISGLATASEERSNPSELPENKSYTTNADVTNISSKSAVVDLFFELESQLTRYKLEHNLMNAWSQDPLATLKVVFNSRSIHLGKASRIAFYRACGWLYENHPLTLLMNLMWLVRPIIEKRALEKGQAAKFRKAEAKDFEEDIFIEYLDLDEDDFRHHDVRDGVSHGYWKDLLNLLALAANDELHVRSTPRLIINVHQTSRPEDRNWSHEDAQKRQKENTVKHHQKVVEKLQKDDRYRALHVTVARLFAEQLLTDKKLLESSTRRVRRRISFAAKWAPSFKGFHDRNTFIASSIAEILHPRAEASPYAQSRENFLKCARLAFQQRTLSPLRKELGVVERNLSAMTYNEIRYDRVPSKAMNQHLETFIKKDGQRFESYLEEVAQGQRSISGATLLPSTLVRAAQVEMPIGGKHTATQLLADKTKEIKQRVYSEQWNTLVQRIRDSGKLSSSIAVCDMSGSMMYPKLQDGTTPIDSSIGLSLLISEVTEPPFGGIIISFSKTPEAVVVGGKDDSRSFKDKIGAILNTHCGMNTDFAAVFEKLVLPTAVKNKVAPKDMVKQIFVFSDMQFDDCGGSISDTYATSYERIKREYEKHGYEIPKLIFWNLAGASYDSLPKPVTADDLGTALVSGYSQGMLKVFLDNGNFDDVAGQDVEVTSKDEADNEDIVIVEKESKMDPLAIVKKAIGHKAYDMLKVMD